MHDLLPEIERRAELLPAPKLWNDERLGRLNRAAMFMRDEATDPQIKKKLLNYENKLVREDRKHVKS